MLKQISDPTLVDCFSELKKDIFYNLNCLRIGVIDTFDAASQTASVILVDKKVIETYFNTELKDYSLLTDCPVRIDKGAQGGLTIPINKGDYCVVGFADRDIDNWWQDGNIQATNTARSHSLSDGMVIGIIRSAVNPIANYNNSATELNYQETKISLDEKVGIENSSKNLKTLIDSLFTVLQNLKVVGEVPITPATNTALVNLKNEFDQLLK